MLETVRRIGREELGSVLYTGTNLGLARRGFVRRYDRLRYMVQVKDLE